MTAPPLGSYLPGNSSLHRLRPGAKLLGLFACATAAIALRSPLSATVALALGLALTLTAGLRGRDLWRISLRFAAIGLLLFAFQAWQQGWEQAFAVVGTLFALILAASAVTASTRVEDTLETITWALGPLGRFGVHPTRVALAFSLVLTTIPQLLLLARETRDAARARGLDRSLRARLVPFVIRSVGHAQRLGTALEARGLADDDDPPTPRSRL